MATGDRLSPAALGRLARGLALPDVCGVPSSAPLHVCKVLKWAPSGDGKWPTFAICLACHVVVVVMVMGSVHARDGRCGACGRWWGVGGAAVGALERWSGHCGVVVSAAAPICMWGCRGERDVDVAAPLACAALGTARGGCKAVGMGEWGPRPAFEHACHPSARFGIEGWVPCGCGGLPEACVLFVALFACSSGQRIGLQGVCVWCTKPLPAHARAPGTPPRAATRVVVTTIAIGRCIRCPRCSQKVFPTG